MLRNTKLVSDHNKLTGCNKADDIHLLTASRKHSSQYFSTDGLIEFLKALLFHNVPCCQGCGWNIDQ